MKQIIEHADHRDAVVSWEWSLRRFRDILVGCKLYGVLRTSVAPSFWVNAIVTMLILLGPAVQDSANGDDAAAAFAVRFLTFIGVTVYAWCAIAFLEAWRARRRRAVPATAPFSA